MCNFFKSQFLLTCLCYLLQDYFINDHNSPSTRFSAFRQVWLPPIWNYTLKYNSSQLGTKCYSLKIVRFFKVVVQARLSGNLTDGGSSSLHWSAKTQLSAPQDLSLLHSYQSLTTVFQLLFINLYNNLHIWNNSFEEVWKGKTSKFCNTRAKYDINFFSRLLFYIQQEKSICCDHLNSTILRLIFKIV